MSDHVEPFHYFIFISDIGEYKVIFWSLRCPIFIL